MPKFFVIKRIPSSVKVASLAITCITAACYQLRKGNFFENSPRPSEKDSTDNTPWVFHRGSEL